LATRLVGVWGADIILSTPVGTLNEHEITIDDEVDYGIYFRVGAQASNTDTLLYYVYAATKPPIDSPSMSPLERNISDTKPITFNWPTDNATITAQRSIDNANYVATNGTITFLRTESGKHFYFLTYNAADRPATEGTVRYMLTDGTYIRYISLRISGANVVVPPTLLQLEERTLPAASYFQGGAVQSVTNPVTVGGYSDGQSPNELIDLNPINDKIDEAKTHAAIAALNTQN
jgi:hypothetical protein